MVVERFSISMWGGGRDSKELGITFRMEKKLVRLQISEFLQELNSKRMHKDRENEWVWKEW